MNDRTRTPRAGTRTPSRSYLLQTLLCVWLWQAGRQSDHWHCTGSAKPRNHEHWQHVVHAPSSYYDHAASDVSSRPRRDSRTPRLGPMSQPASAPGRAGPVPVHTGTCSASGSAWVHPPRPAAKGRAPGPGAYAALTMAGAAALHYHVHWQSENSSCSC